MTQRVAGIRRFGAASLDLAWVAAGRFDAYWERNIKPWDMAAGLLMVTESGGKVSDADGGEDDALGPIEPRPFVAFEGRLDIAELIEAARQHAAILDRHRRALREEGQGRMAGIAEQGRAADTPAIERPTHRQRPFEGLLDRGDPKCVDRNQSDAHAVCELEIGRQLRNGRCLAHAR